MKLQERTRQVEEALRRADTAEKASRESTAQTEAIKTQAMKDAETIKVEAESIKREAQKLKEQAEATRLRVEEKILKRYPNLRKLVPGEISICDRYVESFTIENGVVHVKLRNTGGSAIIPDFSIQLFDETGTETDRADISWWITTISPGQTSSDEKPIRSKLSSPVYYSLSFKPPAPDVAADNGQSAEPALAIGDQVIVQSEGNAMVFLATSDSAWQEMLDALSAKSADLIARLILQGKVVATRGGTVCVIVKNGLFSKFVRIKEGPSAGQEGWIPSECVKPFKRN